MQTIESLARKGASLVATCPNGHGTTFYSAELLLLSSVADTNVDRLQHHCRVCKAAADLEVTYPQPHQTAPLRQAQ